MTMNRLLKFDCLMMYVVRRPEQQYPSWVKVAGQGVAASLASKQDSGAVQ